MTLLSPSPTEFSLAHTCTCPVQLHRFIGPLPLCAESLSIADVHAEQPLISLPGSDHWPCPSLFCRTYFATPGRLTMASTGQTKPRQDQKGNCSVTDFLQADVGCTSWNLLFSTTAPQFAFSACDGTRLLWGNSFQAPFFCSEMTFILWWHEHYRTDYGDFTAWRIFHDSDSKRSDVEAAFSAVISQLDKTRSPRENVKYSYLQYLTFAMGGGVLPLDLLWAQWPDVSMSYYNTSWDKCRGWWPYTCTEMKFIALKSISFLLRVMKKLLPSDVRNRNGVLNWEFFQHSFRWALETRMWISEQRKTSFPL